MNRLQTFLLHSIFVFSTQSVFALDEHPRLGILHHTTENSSFQFDCQMMGKELHCDMTQSFIREQVPKDKIAERSKEIYESIVSEKTKPGDCDELAKLSKGVAEAIKNPAKIPVDKRAVVLNLPKEKLRELMDTTIALERVCRKKTIENINTLRNLLLKAESTTCRVGSHSWKEVFQKAPPNYSDPENLPVWISKSEPSGDCGIVLLNRFEQVAISDSKVKFWNYVSRKAITNPNGQMLLGGQCKDLDEESYLYSWRSRDVFLECKTIKFSPF